MEITDFFKCVTIFDYNEAVSVNMDYHNGHSNELVVLIPTA